MRAHPSCERKAAVGLEFRGGLKQRCDSALFHGRKPDLWLNRDKSKIETAAFVVTAFKKKVIYYCCIEGNPPVLFKPVKNSDKHHQLELVNS